MAQPPYIILSWPLVFCAGTWCAQWCSAQQPHEEARDSLIWLDRQIEQVQRAIHQQLQGPTPSAPRLLQYPLTPLHQTETPALEKFASPPPAFPDQLASRLNDLLAERGRALRNLSPRPANATTGFDLQTGGAAADFGVSDPSFGRACAGGLLALALATAVLVEVRRRLGAPRRAEALGDSEISLLAGTPVRSLVA